MENQEYIFGIRAIIEALAAGKVIDKLIARKGLNGELFAELQQACKKKDVRIQYVDNAVLDKVTTANHQGVIAFLSKIDYIKLEQILTLPHQEGREPLVLVLDGITDVRNLGAIARSAHCAGVDAIIVPTKGSAPINGESVKTSAGALHHIPICMTNNSYFAVKFLKDNGMRIVGATEHGADDYYKVDFRKAIVIIMGSEDKGISNQLLKLCDAKAKIPMVGNIESLNVSVAAGIILFETLRQRNSK
ncbi:MAG: 23S rRNA (guanosine(2251)-2'-O)-methyltransferase RlmB [Bacteroidales bacterium]|nr:23S rRNA (guanosine(2251)-2'-O)-methyltransferase RlmB [Bacteroidales bacterium]